MGANEQELDYIQARGQMGAKSPLLWEESEVASLLKGSPLASEVLERLRVGAPCLLPPARAAALLPA